MKTEEEPVVVEQTFAASVDDVWNSITDPTQMRKWYFDNIPDFKPEIGFETQFNIENEGRNFLHIWTVTEVVPKKLLAYNWRFEGYSGDSFVVFELFEHGNDTMLRLTVNVTEDFQEDIPEFKRESCVAGWEYFIGQSLKKHLG